MIIFTVKFSSFSHRIIELFILFSIFNKNRFQQSPTYFSAADPFNFQPSFMAFKRLLAFFFLLPFLEHMFRFYLPTVFCNVTAVVRDCFWVFGLSCLAV
jgi:hypothetical protein